MKDKDKKMEENRFVSTISAPAVGGNVISTQKASASNNDSSCIYGGKNHGVGSVIKNEDGRSFVCTEDGTWQISKE
jgi:hypothetical protein